MENPQRGDVLSMLSRCFDSNRPNNGVLLGLIRVFINHVRDFQSICLFVHVVILFNRYVGILVLLAVTILCAL